MRKRQLQVLEMKNTVREMKLTLGQGLAVVESHCEFTTLLPLFWYWDNRCNHRIYLRE